MSLLNEFTIDLANALDDLQEDLDQAKQAEQTLLQKVSENYDGFPTGTMDADDPEAYDAAPEEYEEKFYELREQQAEIEQQCTRIGKFLEDETQAGEWSHYRFVFREPSTEDGLFIQGRSNALAEEAQERGQAVDEQLFGVSQLLERCKVDAPPEAPDDLTGALPYQVGDWLLSALNEETMSGVDADLGNLSPQEALTSYRNSQQSSTTE